MLICVLCPRGCEIEVCENEGILAISGNACPKGEVFAREEWYSPRRMITSTVRTTSRCYPRVPVKTANPVPKDKRDAIMEAINSVVWVLPVSMGEVIIDNVLGLGVDIVATASFSEVD